MKHAAGFGTLVLPTFTLGLFGYGFQDASQGKTLTVEITAAHSFQPKEVTVNVGDEVVWKNSSRHLHTVTTDPKEIKTKEGKEWAKVPEGAKPFHSGEIAVGKSFQYTFTTPGTYKYACTRHEDKGMMGAVIVKPK